jgi:hypothetical protein
MFGKEKYIQSSFSITFPRYSEIRRRANEFEDILKEQFPGHYSQPQVISVPDELDPEVPRLIFGSKHGFSQIIISQINMTLNATYSPDWQVDIVKGQAYLKERATALFQLLNTIDNTHIYFSGLTTRVRMPSNQKEVEIFNLLKERIVEIRIGGDIHDINVKLTNIIDNKFFSNVTINNYRTWKIEGIIQGIPRLSRNNAYEHGLELIGDFNDRYIYNENEAYYSSQDITEEIIKRGIDQIKYYISIIKGELFNNE